MASFNVVSGILAHGNKWLLTDLLKNRCNFNGFTVTDYAGVSEIMVHGLDVLQAVPAQALNADLDMDMVSEGYFSTLKKSYEEGKVNEVFINNACRYILEA